MMASAFSPPATASNHHFLGEQHLHSIVSSSIMLYTETSLKNGSSPQSLFLNLTPKVRISL